MAKRALFQEWSKLGRLDKEISFIVQEGGGDEEVFVSGILSGLFSLNALLPTNTARLFVPKFHEYFSRHHLMSFTLKPKITREEFEGFVDIMTELPAFSDMDRIIENTTEKLVHHKIVHVSVVYLREATTLRWAKHWMTKAVLGRLRKDLRMIPLYTHLNQDQVAAVR